MSISVTSTFSLRAPWATLFKPLACEFIFLAKAAENSVGVGYLRGFFKSLRGTPSLFVNPVTFSPVVSSKPLIRLVISFCLSSVFIKSEKKLDIVSSSLRFI